MNIVISIVFAILSAAIFLGAIYFGILILTGSIILGVNYLWNNPMVFFYIVGLIVIGVKVYRFLEKEENN